MRVVARRLPPGAATGCRQRRIQPEFGRKLHMARPQELVDRLGTVPALMLEMETAYWTGFDLDALESHARTISGGEPPIVSAQVREDGGGVSLLVAGQDRLGLFSRLAGTKKMIN